MSHSLSSSVQKMNMQKVSVACVSRQEPLYPSSLAALGVIGSHVVCNQQAASRRYCYPSDVPSHVMRGQQVVTPCLVRHNKALPGMRHIPQVCMWGQHRVGPHVHVIHSCPLLHITGHQRQCRYSQQCQGLSESLPAIWTRIQSCL